MERLEQRITQLEEKDAIQSLMNRYCALADSQQWAEYSRCFLSDASVKFNGQPGIVGREAIAALIKAGNSQFEGMQHSLTNLELNIEGDRATGKCYLWFAAVNDMTRPHEFRGFGGPYALSFQRTEEGWRIATLQLTMLWSQSTDSQSEVSDE